jgi:chromosome segregation protein
VRAAAAVNDAKAAVERAERAAAAAAAAEERVNDASVFAQHEAERASRAEEALREQVARVEAESKSNAMLLDAERDRLSAMVASAERERDAVLGDLGSHQARANAEAARRLAVEEELNALRAAHNQALADLQKLKIDVEAGKRAPEVEAEIAALKERLDAAEKASAQKDAKIAEQADRINRLTERLVREAGMA